MKILEAIKAKLDELVNNQIDGTEIGPGIRLLLKVTFRIFLLVVTSAWLAFLPIYLFIIYMFKGRFFSYEFFSEGVFGLKTFLALTLSIIIICSFYAWGFIVTLKLAQQHKKKTGKYGNYLWLSGVLVVVSIGFHFILGLLLAANQNKVGFVLFSLLGLSLMLAIRGYVGVNLLKQLAHPGPSIAFIFASATIPIIDPQSTAQMIAWGLRGFNAGGNVPSEVVRVSDGTVLFEGPLLLLAPQTAYLRDGAAGVRVVRLTEGVTVAIGAERKKVLDAARRADE